MGFHLKIFVLIVYLMQIKNMVLGAFDLMELMDALFIISLRYYSFEVSILSVAKFFEIMILFEKCGEMLEENMGGFGWLFIIYRSSKFDSLEC